MTSDLKPMAEIRNNFTEILLARPCIKIAKRFYATDQDDHQSKNRNKPFNDSSSHADGYFYKLISQNCSFNGPIGDNAVTSSIRIAQIFSDLVGRKTRALWKVRGNVKICN